MDGYQDIDEMWVCRKCGTEFDTQHEADNCCCE